MHITLFNLAYDIAVVSCSLRSQLAVGTFHAAEQHLYVGSHFITIALTQVRAGHMMHAEISILAAAERVRLARIAVQKGIEYEGRCFS